MLIPALRGLLYIFQSLGEVDKALSVDHDTGHVTLSYTNGAPCGGDKKQRAHTSIVFMCDHKESQVRTPKAPALDFMACYTIISKIKKKIKLIKLIKKS